MLTFGFFGSNIREAMMLGKPASAFCARSGLSRCAARYRATSTSFPWSTPPPDTIEEVLTDLVRNPHKRAEIGRRSREFALKWHSADAAARRMDELYRQLLSGGVAPVGR